MILFKNLKMLIIFIQNIKKIFLFFIFIIYYCNWSNFIFSQISIFGLNELKLNKESLKHLNMPLPNMYKNEVGHFPNFIFYLL